jgi:hypothetical protein
MVRRRRHRSRHQSPGRRHGRRHHAEEGEPEQDYPAENVACPVRAPVTTGAAPLRAPAARAGTARTQPGAPGRTRRTARPTQTTTVTVRPDGRRRRNGRAERLHDHARTDLAGTPCVAWSRDGQHPAVAHVRQSPRHAGRDHEERRGPAGRSRPLRRRGPPRSQATADLDRSHSSPTSAIAHSGTDCAFPWTSLVGHKRLRRCSKTVGLRRIR